jgi:acetylornithine/succinyldiaminopimelate/putrescine aminotransferase
MAIAPVSDHVWLTNVTYQTVLRLLPPLVAPKAELERFLGKLEEAVENIKL